MADGPSVSKKCRYQNRQSPDRTRVFNLTSVQARLYPVFAILQLGPDCNAHKSFTEAKCNFKKVGTGGIPYLIDFDDIFSKGIDLLFDLKNGTRVSNEDNREPWTFCMIFSKRKVSVSRDLVVVINTGRSC